MKSHAQASVMAALAADSLALGAHWIYDPQEIENRFGRVESLLDPGQSMYHTNRGSGDLTHYGDQMLVLLESIAESGGFDENDFSARWQKLFQDYDGYLDQATQGTLANLAAGWGPLSAGSSSNDLSGAARIAPLIFLDSGDPEALAAQARIQTQLTHNDPDVLDAAELFARAIHRILSGARVPEAFEEIMAHRFKGHRISTWFHKGLDSSSEETVAAISRLGQNCHVDQAFSAVIHLVAKYPNNLSEALIQNVMAGGDSAARGQVVAMILAAANGLDPKTEGWFNGLKARDKILALLDRIENRGKAMPGS